MRQNERRSVDTLYDFSHGIGFTASRYAQKDLVAESVLYTFRYALYGLRLVTRRLIWGYYFKLVHYCSLYQDYLFFKIFVFLLYFFFITAEMIKPDQNRAKNDYRITDVTKRFGDFSEYEKAK